MPCLLILGHFTNELIPMVMWCMVPHVCIGRRVRQKQVMGFFRVMIRFFAPINETQIEALVSTDPSPVSLQFHRAVGFEDEEKNFNQNLPNCAYNVNLPAELLISRFH